MEKKSKYVADNIFTDYKHWKQLFHITQESTMRERDLNRRNWEIDYNRRLNIKTDEEYEEYLEEIKEMLAKKDEEQKKREKAIRRGKIETGIKITCITLAVAALISGFVLIKNSNDKYHEEYYAKHYDKNGTPVQVAITEYDEYITPFDKACKYEVDGDKVTKKINANCVYFYINNETGDVVPLVLIDGDTNAPRGVFGKHYYNLDEELVICYKNFPDLFDSRYMNQEYYDYLTACFEKKTMKDALAKVNIQVTNDYYTKEEIEEFKDELLKANSLIYEAKSQSR